MFKMQRLEVSCAVRRIYTSLGAKGLKSDRYNGYCKGNTVHTCQHLDSIWCCRFKSSGFLRFAAWFLYPTFRKNAQPWEVLEGFSITRTFLKMRIIFSIETLRMYNPVIQHNNLEDMNSYLNVTYVVKHPPPTPTHFFLFVRLRLDNTEKGGLFTHYWWAPLKYSLSHTLLVTLNRNQMEHGQF